MPDEAPISNLQFPLVSVVMSVYNGRHYLPAAIESILNQTYPNFEFIIIDDGSNDGAETMLAEYARQNSGRITLLRNPQNIGYTRSLNRGLQEARGNYIARQDADDISEPTRLAEQVTFMEAHPQVGLVGTMVQLIDAEDRPLDFEYFPPAYDNATIQERLLVGNCLCHGSVMMRRHCLAQTGFYDVSLEPSEDYDLWLRLGEVADIANLQKPLYRYRYHAGSVSGRRYPQQMFNHARLLENAVQRRFGPTPPANRLWPVAHAYLRAAVAHYTVPNLDIARQSLVKALALTPDLLAADEPLATILVDTVTKRPPEFGDRFLQTIFSELLPSSRIMSRLRASLLSDLHMREVFSAAREGRPRQVKAHLWPGLRHNPAWLLNRGVWAIMARSLWQRGE